jgi:hypothetical protein
LRDEFGEEEYKTFNNALLSHVLSHKSLKISTGGSYGKVERTAYDGGQVYSPTGHRRSIG